MTQPLLDSEPLDEAAVSPTVASLFAHLLRREEETQAALDEITSRLGELLGCRAATSDAPIADAVARYHEYEQVVARLRDAVRAAIPAGARVLVISKGDDALLALDGRPAQHFPQSSDGRYAGFHPADSAAVIAHLDALVESGAEFLVIPATALWWLEHYREFAQHLAAHARTVFRDDTTGAIFALRERDRPAPRAGGDLAERHFHTQLRALVRSLLPRKARLLVISKGDPELLAFDGLSAAHFPQDTSGEYAGYHPADSATAIAHLEELRASGTEYLLIPKPSVWWLDYYAGFRAHLETRARLVSRQQYLGILYALANG